MVILFFSLFCLSTCYILTAPLSFMDKWMSVFFGWENMASKRCLFHPSFGELNFLFAKCKWNVFTIYAIQSYGFCNNTKNILCADVIGNYDHLLLAYFNNTITIYYKAIIKINSFIIKVIMNHISFLSFIEI